MNAQKSGPSHILRHFAYDHLPPHLQEVSKPFYILAHEMDRKLDNTAEKNAGLRKLLEAKDCLVRGWIETLDTNRRPVDG